MKVYVVEHCSLAVMEVLGVFSTYEKATAYMDRHSNLENEREWLSLQEYEVDNEES